MKTRAYLCIVAGASLWGLIGLFVKGLTAQGFTALQIVAMRTLASAIFITPLILFDKVINVNIAIIIAPYHLEMVLFRYRRGQRHLLQLLLLQLHPVQLPSCSGTALIYGPRLCHAYESGAL